MVITRKHSQTAPPPVHHNTTAGVIPTICIDVNEKNNNNLCNNNNNSLSVTQPIGKHGVLTCLPDIFTEIDLNNRNGLNGHYLKDDLYKPYILGKSTRHHFHHQPNRKSESNARCARAQQKSIKPSTIHSRVP